MWWIAAASAAIPLGPVEFHARPSPALIAACPMTSVELGFTGDAMVHGQQLLAARQKDGSYAMDGLFDAVTPWTSEPDAMFANLETNIAGQDQEYTGYPRFNSPSVFLDELKSAGIDVLQTANNHCLDRGILGNERTLDAVDARGFAHAGTYRTVREHLQPFVMLDLPGNLHVALLAYTYGTEAGILPASKAFRVAVIDPIRIQREVSQARAAGADLVVVGLHWGIEYQDRPEPGMVALARFLTDEADVDIVWGTHPHVVQPAEVRSVPMPTGGSRDALIMYSLGNFVSNQTDFKRDGGVIVRVNVLRCASLDRTWLADLRVLPVWVDRRDKDRKNSFRVFPTPTSPLWCGGGDISASDCAAEMRFRAHIATLYDPQRLSNALGDPLWITAATLRVLPDPADPRPRPYFTYYAPLIASN